MPSKRVSLKGKGADLFFGDYTPGNGAADHPTPRELAPTPTPQEVDAPPSVPANTTQPNASAALADDEQRTPAVQPVRRRKSAEPAENRATSLLASKQDVADVEVVEAIRRVVRVPGREVSYIRVSPEEKAQVADIVYAYKKQGQRTTENEINRIALNYLLNDYHEHGDQSMLARVLATLQA